MLPRLPFVVDTTVGEVHGVEVRPVQPSATILLVHDLDRDLDQMAGLTTALAGVGYACVAIDLPGHGLSDGDVVEPERCVTAVHEVVAALRARGGRLGFVSTGRAATIGSTVGSESGVEAQLLVSPRLDDAIAAAGERRFSIRMVVHGEGTSLVGTETQRFFSPLLGEKLLVSNPEVTDDVRVVTRSETLRTHVILFFRRYLAPDPRRLAP